MLGQKQLEVKIWKLRIGFLKSKHQFNMMNEKRLDIVLSKGAWNYRAYEMSKHPYRIGRSRFFMANIIKKPLVQIA